MSDVGNQRTDQYQEEKNERLPASNCGGLLGETSEYGVRLD
jgi:hypothetical protein